MWTTWHRLCIWSSKTSSRYQNEPYPTRLGQGRSGEPYPKYDMHHESGRMFYLFNSFIFFNNIFVKGSAQPFANTYYYNCQNQSKYWYTCQGISSALKSRTLKCSKYIYRSKWIVCFFTGKSIILCCWGWSKWRSEPVNNAPVCTVGSTVKNSQLTDFDHYSYLPLKFSYSRRVFTRHVEHCL